MSRLLTFLLFTLWSGAAIGAQIGPVSGSSIGCTIQVSGQIVAGDAERLRALIDDPWRYSGRVCFDSPGGSWMEGIALARAMRMAPTGVDAGKTCESACFIAFMAGMFHRQEDRTPVPDRVMHPTARVGFHAPALTVADSLYRAEDMSRAYKVALHSIAELIRLREERSDYHFRDRLLDELLRVPPEEMRYLETVGDAVLFGIAVHPVALPDPVTSDHSAQACKAFGRMSEDFSMTDEFSPSSLTQAQGRIDYSAFFNPGESASECLIQYFADRRYHDRPNADKMLPDWSVGMARVTDWYIPPNDFEVGAFMHYGFDTPIAALPWHAGAVGAWAVAFEEPETEFRTCAGPKEVTVVRVADYANLRAQPDYRAAVVGRAMAFEEAERLTDRTFAMTPECQAACADGWRSEDRVTRCVRAHQVWVPIRTRSGAEGFISRKFLE